MIKLDLGCGKNKKEGFIGIDIEAFPGVDKVLDLRTKWPYKDNSVDEVYCSHLLEHLTGEERIFFMNELYRVMKVGKKATIIVPHWGSGRAYGDPTHKWPPVVEMFFFYLNKEWRDINAPHVKLNCNFDATWGYNLSPEFSTKSQEAQFFAINHYRESAYDLIATLIKKK